MSLFLSKFNLKAMKAVCTDASFEVPYLCGINILSTESYYNFSKIACFAISYPYLYPCILGDVYYRYKRKSKQDQISFFYFLFSRKDL